MCVPKLSLFVSTPAGAGVSFGADITRAFLRANDLKFIVRSHECVRSGYDEPYSGADKKLLCTIFSASDYGGSGNAAAILQFHVPTEKELAAHQAKVEAAAATAAEEGEEKKADTFMNLADAIQQMEQAEEAPLEYTELKFVPDTDLCYRVHHYFVAPNFFDQEVGAALLDAHQSTTDLTALHTLQNSGAVAQQEGATAAAAAAVNEEQSTGTAIAAGGGGGGGDGGRGPASLAAAGRSISLPIAAGRRQSLDHDGLPLSAASTSSPTGTDMTLSPPDFSSGSGRFARSRSLTAGTTTGAGNLNFAHMLGSVDFDDEAGANDGLVVSDKDCVLIGSRTSLFEFIVSRLDELTKEFEVRTELCFSLRWGAMRMTAALYLCFIVEFSKSNQREVFTVPNCFPYLILYVYPILHSYCNIFKRNVPL